MVSFSYPFSMTRIARVVVPGIPHHLTQRGVRSIDVFRSDPERMGYLHLLREEIDRYGVEILAWCLMTNHVHFIAIPAQETSLARAFGETHRRYTSARNAAEGVRGYLFQGRFASCPLDEPHLFAAVRYTELNPVHAGIVQSVWEYAWSSARYHLGEVERDPLLKTRALMGMAVDWREFLKTGDEESLDALRKATRTGRPAGDEAFIARLEQLTHTSLHAGKRGRPKKVEGS
ncbi:MAG: transposase [bacterium]